MNSAQIKVQDAFVDLLAAYIHVILNITVDVGICHEAMRDIEDHRLLNNKVGAIKSLRTWSQGMSVVVTFLHNLAGCGPLKTALSSCFNRFTYSEVDGTVTIGRRVGLKDAKDFIDLYWNAMAACVE
jgi:hypothetical protein